MKYQDEKPKRLFDSTKRAERTRPLEEDGASPIDMLSGNGNTLHGVLQKMIAHNEKVKVPVALTMSMVEKHYLQENVSYPLDLMQGDTLCTAFQIMIERDEKIKLLYASTK